jgi:hypothetical protein
MHDSLVSQDDEVASGDKNSDICPTDLASSHLLETNDLSTSVVATISPVFGMQTANDSLVSRDDKTASGDKNLDICPTLVNYIATLEQ